MYKYLYSPPPLTFSITNHKQCLHLYIEIFSNQVISPHFLLYDSKNYDNTIFSDAENWALPSSTQHRLWLVPVLNIM